MKKVVLAQDLRLDGSKAVGANGELNATSKRDLLNRITASMSTVSEMTSRNVVIANNEGEATEMELAQARRDMIVAAFESEREHTELGQFMGQELYIAGNRDGFARRFLLLSTLGRGMTPHTTLRNKNVLGVVVTSTSRVETQFIRDKDFYPQEFYVQSRVFVEKRDLDRTNADVLQEKYIEAQEGTMVQEDRVWKQAANATVNQDNEFTLISGSVTPLSLGRLRNKVTRWNIPAKWWLIANDIWTDITADSGFQQVIDPVSKFELLKTGVLGRIMGLEVITDAYRHPQHKVLDIGEQWVIGSEINHGTMTDRGGIEVEPITTAIEGVPGKGWHMHESISMLIANGRSIAKAIRQ